MRFSLDGEPHNGKAWAHRPDDRHRLCYRTSPGHRHRHPHLHRFPLLRIPDPSHLLAGSGKFIM